MNRSRPAAVHTPTRPVAGSYRAVRTAGQPRDRMPGAHGCRRPKATGVSHRHVQSIQQPPQPYTASCAQAMLYIDAARMARLISDDHQATAPGTYGISNRIHEDTVGASHDGRERSPDAPGSIGPNRVGQHVCGERCSDYVGGQVPQAGGVCSRGRRPRRGGWLSPAAKAGGNEVGCRAIGSRRGLRRGR
jgi:hypothetical protein